MVGALIATCLAILLAFNLGRVWTVLTIIKQLPKDVNFEFSVYWFGKTKIEFLDKDNKTND